jgi:hypothetical protein
MVPINILKVGDSFVQQAATDSRARDGNKTEEGERLPNVARDRLPLLDHHNTPMVLAANPVPTLHFALLEAPNTTAIL